MFEHALRSAPSSQALIACSHMYHVNLWRRRTVDSPRIFRVRGHRTPEYYRALRQHGELQRDYNLYSDLFSTRVVPTAMKTQEYSHIIMDSCAQRGEHLWKIWTNGLHQQRLVEENLKLRRLWQRVSGRAITRRRSQALVIRSCWCQTGVYYSSIKQLVPYPERQMAQLSISSQQPGDSTSPSTFGHAA